MVCKAIFSLRLLLRLSRLITYSFVRKQEGDVLVCTSTCLGARLFTCQHELVKK